MYNVVGTLTPSFLIGSYSFLQLTRTAIKACVFIMLSRLFIAVSWSPAGKGLASWPLFLMFNCVFVTFPCGILGQAWYLIVSILGLCHLSYFHYDRDQCNVNNRKMNL